MLLNSRYLTIWALCLLLAADSSAQPVVQTTSFPKEVVAGSTALIELEMTWSDGQEQFVAYPPEIPPSEHGELTILKMRGAARKGQKVIAYTLAFTPENTGPCSLPEITFPYMPEDAASDGAIPEPSLAVHHRLDDIVVAGPRSQSWSLALILLFAIALAGTAGGWRYWRYRQGSPAEAAGPDFQARLHEVRRYRLDGDFYAYFKALTEMAGQMGGTAAELRGRLERRTQEVGYQGTRPPDDELDGWMNDIEHAIRKWREENVSA